MWIILPLAAMSGALSYAAQWLARRLRYETASLIKGVAYIGQASALPGLLLILIEEPSLEILGVALAFVTSLAMGTWLRLGEQNNNLWLAWNSYLDTCALYALLWVAMSFVISVASWVLPPFTETGAQRFVFLAGVFIWFAAPAAVPLVERICVEMRHWLKSQ